MFLPVPRLDLEKFPLDRISWLAKYIEHDKYPYLHIINPLAWFCAIGDMGRWAFRWIQYPLEACKDWNLEKEIGPGLMYRIAYFPVIANCNPFMLPPYIEDQNYVSRHMRCENSETYTATEKSILIKESESGVELSKNRFLYVNDKEIKLERMPGGKYTVNLRDPKLVPQMLPPQDIKLIVKDNKKNVIDLTIKTTGIMDGKHLYLWNLLNDKKADYSTRFIALHKLHDLKLLNNNDFANIKRSVLGE